MDRFLKYWWVCALICLAMTAGLILMEIRNYHLSWLEDMLLAGFMLTAGLQILLFIVSLFKRRFLVALGVFLGGIVNLYAFLMLCFMLWMLQGENDDFGQRHPIPAGMECQEPNESFCEEDVDSTDINSWLRIHDEFQPGIYEVQYFSQALPDGYLYLKCFEATEDIALSTDRIFQRTKKEVDHHKEFGPVGGYSVFTLYEGDMGDFYAVRVEVWHHDAKTNKEKMLCQKIYRMQGWER